MEWYLISSNFVELSDRAQRFLEVLSNSHDEIIACDHTSYLFKFQDKASAENYFRDLRGELSTDFPDGVFWKSWISSDPNFEPEYLNYAKDLAQAFRKFVPMGNY